jgi:hypothetical protein
MRTGTNEKRHIEVAFFIVRGASPHRSAHQKIM